VGPKRASPGSTRGQGAGRRQWRRRRLCLLKGCTKWFVPGHPVERYCAEECRREAERWRRWKAAARYRGTEEGKKKRQGQCQRHRERRKKRRETSAEPRREGHRKRRSGELFSCARPGCYERFCSRRSPLRRFCSFPCRKALRRVELREARLQLEYRLAGARRDDREDSRLTHMDRGRRPP